MHKTAGQGLTHMPEIEVSLKSSKSVEGGPPSGVLKPSPGKPLEVDTFVDLSLSRQDSAVGMSPDPQTAAFEAPNAEVKKQIKSSFDVSKVKSEKSLIDVRARQEKEMNGTVDKMKEFVTNFTVNDEGYKSAIAKYTTDLKGFKSEKVGIEKELNAAKAEQPQDSQKITELEGKMTAVEQGNEAANTQKLTASKSRAELKKLNTEYTKTLKDLNSLTSFEEKYDKIMPGRSDDIKQVRANLNNIYEKTGRKMAILGRTDDTFSGTNSWVSKHAGETDRVLHADNWSMAVNDAFMKAGLDQKAQFAMVTKFKDEVKSKIKDLLLNPAGRSPEQIKQAIRDFAKDRIDSALYTGGAHNDGFAVSMIELEQIIDDGYVMMEHDLYEVKPAPSSPGGLKPEAVYTPVMIPSGKGQKIKEELKQAVAKRAQLKGIKN